MIGINISKFVESNNRDIVNRLDSASPQDQPEFSIEKKDGSTSITQWSVSRSETDDCFFCVVHDITERKRVDALKKEFLSMVSHDIRTPLTSLQGALMLLLTGALGQEKVQATLNSSLRNTERLIRLVSELLDLEKADSGELTVTLTTTSLETVIEQAVESIEVFANDHGVAIKAEKTTATVLGEEKRLVQVLINLLSNAVKFSPERSEIVVSVVELDHWTEVRVTDQGRGIPENLRKSIFDRFKQVEHSDASTKGGTGLGLAISKTIIEKHMGSIGVDSEVGIGSTFWFRLPRC